MMDEKRQNEVCCELVPKFQGAVVEADTTTFRGRTILFIWQKNPKHPNRSANCYLPFTQSHEHLHLLRAAVIEAGKGRLFVTELIAITHPDPDATLNGGIDMGRGAMGALSYRDAAALMQAKPHEQVEAALRAMGRWQE